MNEALKQKREADAHPLPPGIIELELPEATPPQALIDSFHEITSHMVLTPNEAAIVERVCQRIAQENGIIYPKK